MNAAAHSASRRAAARITAVAALVLTLFITAVNHARISRVEDLLRASDLSSQLGTLATRYAALASDVQTLRAEPPELSEVTFNAVKAEWEARLSRLEQFSQALPGATDLKEVQDRMSALEGRLARTLRRSASAAAISVSTPSPSSASVPSPANTEPPFLPLSIELRGGERYLTIVPQGVSSLRHARALRVGDREGAWTLERLEGTVAEFRVEGQLRRIGVPQ